MTADPHVRRPRPFEVARIVSSPTPQAKDLRDWCAEMVAISRQRDRGCFLRVYDHFMPRVCLYLRGLGSSEAVAEELAQEALLRLWQRAGSYDPQRSRLSTWLFCIARNLHIDRVRKEPGWTVLQEAMEGMDTDDDIGATSSAEAYAEQVELKGRIDRLPATQARLIRMSYLEAKSHQQIARELGMPLGSVKSGVRRAFLKLQSAVRVTTP